MKLKMCKCKKDGDCFFCSSVEVYHVASFDNKGKVKIIYSDKGVCTLPFIKKGEDKMQYGVICPKCFNSDCKGFLASQNEWECIIKKWEEGREIIMGNDGVKKPNLGILPRKYWLLERINHCLERIKEFELERLYKCEEICRLDKMLVELSYTLDMLMPLLPKTEVKNEETK